MIKFNPTKSTSDNLKAFGYTHRELKSGITKNDWARAIYKGNTCVGFANYKEVNKWLKNEEKI
jgi:hypothetical protein